jgi:acyl-CoA synthetase (AMP-forming)/AMP-acid ligase II
LILLNEETYKLGLSHSLRSKEAAMSDSQTFLPALGRGINAASLGTWIDIVQHHAEHFPDDLAIKFLVDGESKEALLTFAELDKKARTIAVSLLATTEPGSRALLLFPPGLDYIASFFGCLYAGMVAVPAYPPDPSPQRLARTLPRLQTIVADSSATVVLTNAMIQSIAPALYPHAPEFAELTWTAVDKLDEAASEAWKAPDIEPDTLAFLQYTSGSTGTPKGVMLSHANLIADIELIHEKFGHTQESVAIHWLPPYHDMGLIGAILTPVHGAFPAVLMSPMSFLRRPYRWLQAIHRESRPTSAGAPNFAFELCMRKTTPEQRAELDLSNWVIAYTGAEPIRPSTLEAFTEAFTPSGFKDHFHYPCYGLAEATLLVTGASKPDLAVSKIVEAKPLEDRRVVPADEASDTTRELVSVGRASAHHVLKIVDPDTLVECDSSSIGELWIHAPIVAHGYWRQDERTSEIFGARLPGDNKTYLRTGDLAFLDDGDVYIAGRLKDMIIIRGANHYPQDLELTAENAHPAIRKGCVAAFALDKDGEEHLGLVAEVDTRDAGFDGDEVLRVLTREINAHHRISPAAIALIEAKTIAKTSSGKIQRFQSKASLLDGSLRVVVGVGL